MKSTALLTSCFFFLIAGGSAQNVKPDTVPAKIINGDTIPYIDMKTAIVFPPYTGKMPVGSVKYDRFVMNVKKVYPYAKLAGAKLNYYRQVLDTIPNEKKRKAYIKMAEKQLEDQFGDQVRDLTFSQGKILIKLIYRETGSSSFDIVRELRGGFSAFIWQTLARLFGYDLKTTYDPAGEDEALERVVLMIEAGQI